MAEVNLLDELVYVTLEEARGTSDVFTTTVPDDNSLTKIITQAQWLIDWYIGSFRTKFVSTQTFIFPIEDEDWDEEDIPTDIKLATIRISEYVYDNGSTFNDMNGKVISEKNMSRSVDFSDKESISSYIETIWIPKRVLNILDNYKSDFIWQVI